MGVVVSSSRVVSAAPSFSHSSPAPAWGPFHGRQFSTNFSSVSPPHGLQFFTNRVGPFRGVQSFSNTLLQHRSPMQTQVLPEDLLQCGLLSMENRLCQGPVPMWLLHGLQLPSGHIFLLRHGVLHRLQHGHLLHC